MQYTFNGTFKAEIFSKSKFKPKKAVATIEEISSSIKNICNDIEEITNVYNDLVTKSVNSSEWVTTAREITKTSNSINESLKKVSTSIVSDMMEIYDSVDSVNKQLSFEISEQKEVMANSLNALKNLNVGNIKAPSSSTYQNSNADFSAQTETTDAIVDNNANTVVENQIDNIQNTDTVDNNNIETANIDKSQESGSTVNISEQTSSSKATTIPSEVKQTGITKNYTNYDYFYNKWSNGTNQRNIADTWAESGRNSNNGIATINDRYLVAVSTKFGNVGDNIDVVLDDGTVINCTIADAKGSDATSEWGHVLGGGGVDVIEWESVGSADVINIDEWKGKKVSTIINTSC